MFKKILIANRGEIALRIIRSCHEMGISTVAVYSTADELSLHVRFADEAVCIGPPPGNESYLNIPQIISAAEITNADAIHPGYGFLAENADFAQICQDNNIVFIGPSPEVIRSMGDKSYAKKTMKKAGVPVIPGSEDVITSAEEAAKLADTIGYPVILKATAGGGGRGMRLVENESEIYSAFSIASNEAQSAFGNPGLYLEKYIEKPRHIEMQILGDFHGNVVHLCERECSIQRRHQKLLEESPSPVVTPEIRESLGNAAIKGAKSVGYQSAGTIEFLMDKYGNFYFMEMNTRIQVEHPVTEMILGIDLIKEQINVAMKHEIPEYLYNLKPRGHALEVRINAEDPENNFRPSPSRVESLHFPGGPGFRVDSHIYAGYTIPPFYDSLIAKLIAHASARGDTITKMRCALEETIIEGVKTTIPFHMQLLENQQFIDGDFDTGFLDRFFYKT